QLHAQGGQVDYIADGAVVQSLPGTLCYAVLFRQFPVARVVPEGLQPGNVFTVTKGGKVEMVSDPEALKKFFQAALRPVDGEATAERRPGPRPICQATKLLDPDPVVRRMAEQDLLIMGRAVKPYLDEQRARAEPGLRKAIDRLWQRILDEDR